MIRWERYTQSFRDYSILFFILTLSLLLIINNKTPQVTWIRSHVLNATGVWNNWMSSIYQYRSLKRENEIIRIRLAALSYENSLLKEAYLENDRLRQMLDFKKSSAYDLIPASIIVQNYEGFSHAILLDIGTSDGVQPGMPVLASKGLVGRVVTAGDHISVVQVLDDINFRVGAMIQRTRITGIVKNTDENKLILNYVPITEDIKLGDVIITSGNSAIYPKGIEIGYVSKVEEPPAALFKLIEITTSVNLNNLDDSFIIGNPRR